MISIIVTAYNVEKYLSQCLESCMKQSFNDIEIIVVNDGSKDNTENIIKEYCKQDKRIKYLCQENSGVSVARNNGMRIASGDYVMFVDGDDYLSEKIISELAVEIDPETDIVACCCKGFDDNGEYPNYFFDNSYTMVSVNEKERLYLQLMKTEAEQPDNQSIFTGIGVPWGKLYRKTFLDSNMLKFNPELKRMQDNIFNTYAFSIAKKIKYLNSPLYYYRIDHISSYKKHYQAEIYYKILQERQKFFETNNEYNYNKLLKAFYYEKMDFLICSMKNICKSNKLSQSIKLIKEYSGREIYKNFLEKKYPEDPIKLKLMRFLLKSKLYGLIYVVYQIKP